MAVERQLALIEHLEASDDAYRQAIDDCGLPDSAHAVAVWLFDRGRREVIEGQRCQVARARSKAQLATAVRQSASSAYRGLRKLLDLGLVERHGEDWVLVMTRVCVVGEARATGEASRNERRLDRGWSAEATVARLLGSGADRGPPGPPGPPPVQPGSPLVQPGSAWFSPVQPAFRTEKGSYKFPENLTETEPNRFGDAANQVDQGEPERTGVNRREPGRTARAERAAPGDVRAAKQALNRTAAWQALQPEDFADGPPGLPKLRACYREAVRAGVLADCYEDRLKFLATAYALSKPGAARNPAGAFVHRCAERTLHWACADSQEGYQWAKAIVERRAAGERPANTETEPIGVGRVTAAMLSNSMSPTKP